MIDLQPLRAGFAVHAVDLPEIIFCQPRWYALHTIGSRHASPFLVQGTHLLRVVFLPFPCEKVVLFTVLCMSLTGYLFVLPGVRRICPLLLVELPHPLLLGTKGVVPYRLLFCCFVLPETLGLVLPSLTSSGCCSRPVSIRPIQCMQARLLTPLVGIVRVTSAQFLTRTFGAYTVRCVPW